MICGRPSVDVDAIWLWNRLKAKLNKGDFSRSQLSIAPLPVQTNRNFPQCRGG